MASQSGCKVTFASIAAKQASNPTPTINVGYDRRRAMRFVPMEENANLNSESCKQFVAHIKTLIAPSPPSGVTAIRMASEKELHVVVATPGLVDKLVAMSPVEVAGQALKSNTILAKIKENMVI